MDYDVIIIGGGVAGMTAGIYCVRRGLNTLIIERGSIGGQILTASEIENYPGFERISGVDLAAKIEEQSKSLGVKFLLDEAVELRLKDSVKKVKVASGEEHVCRAVIIASGGEHRKLETKGEKEYSGKGVSYCATCDAPFFKNKDVAVVGGGNTAVEDALYLSEIADKVYLIHRRDKLRAEESRQKRLKERSNIKLVLNSVVSEIGGTRMVEHVKTKDAKTGAEKTINVGGVFISIGITPTSELVKKTGVELDDKGYIKINRSQETNIPGVFAAGDVTGGILQASKAAGEGCVAALSAYSYVKKPYWIQ